MATPVYGMSKRFFHLFRPLLNTNEAYITKTKRSTYVRCYPTTLVQPDGSTFTIRYHEPRQIIQMPLKFEELSAAEKQVVLAKRRPKQVLEKKQDFSVDFDSKKYLKYVNTRKPTNK